MRVAAPKGCTWERPTFTPVADHALLIGFGDEISDETSAAVVALDRALAASPPEGLIECVPAFVNLLVEFDPLLADHDSLQKAVENLLLSSGTGLQGQGASLHEVEICYEGSFASDLEQVAQSLGLSVEATIECHLRGDYQVRMYGFAPGYAYMSGVPIELQVPRKAVVLRDVPAGSVIIAGPQCLITTLTMPTGWCILGRSPTRILTRDESSPFLFEVGDRVRFKRVDLSQFERSEALALKANDG